MRFGMKKGRTGQPVSFEGHDSIANRLDGDDEQTIGPRAMREKVSKMESEPHVSPEQRRQNDRRLPNDAAQQGTDSERNAYLRLLADFENYKRNAESRVQSAWQRGQDEMLRHLIPAIADLEHAVGSSTSDAGAVRHGIDLALRKLESILRGLGYDRIDTRDQLMDPALHEAIAARPAPRAHGIIIDEVAPGYRRNESLVAPAKVVVATGPVGQHGRKGGDVR